MNEDHATVTRVGLYAQLLPVIREVALKHGYAIGLHGSMVRDLDLIAVPWVEECSDAPELVVAIRDALGGFVPLVTNSRGWEIDDGTERAHGRRAWNICFGGSPFIDVSVMPRREP